MIKRCFVGLVVALMVSGSVIAGAMAPPGVILDNAPPPLSTLGKVTRAISQAQPSTIRRAYTGAEARVPLFDGALVSPRPVFFDGSSITSDATGAIVLDPYGDRVMGGAGLQWFWRMSEPTASTTLTDLKAGVVLTASNNSVNHYGQPGLLAGGGLGVVAPSAAPWGSTDGSYFFNAGTDYFQAASAIWAPTTTAPWSVSFMARPAMTRSGSTAQYAVLSTRDSANNYGGIVIGETWDNSVSKTVVDVIMASLGNNHYNEYRGSIDLANATAAAVTVNFNGNVASTNGGLTVYVNGVADTLRSVNATLVAGDNMASTVALTVGKEPTPFPNPFKGNVSNLSISSIVPAASEVAYLHGLALGRAQPSLPAFPLNVIADNDTNDDIGNLDFWGLLNVMANSGDVNIVAEGVSDSATYSGATVQAINNFEGRGSTPLGVNQTSSVTTDNVAGSTVASAWSTSSYTVSYFGAQGLTPVAVYRRALCRLIGLGQKAVIVSAGPLSNLSALLASSADGNCSLTGSQLITQAVSATIITSGRWPISTAATPSTPEFNIASDITAAQAVLDSGNWPGAITVVGVEMGDNAYGAPLSSNSPWAASGGPPGGDIYQNIWAGASNLTNGKRQVWDALPVIYLMSGLGTVFDDGGLSGTASVDGSGNNSWAMTAGNISYVRLRLTSPKLGALVDKLMSRLR